jgi:hypothetical protein
MRKQWTRSVRSHEAIPIVRVALSALMLGALTACGGGSSPAGSNGPTRTVIGTQSGTLVPLTADQKLVSVTQSGTLDASLDWGNAGNDFDMYITSNSCNPPNLDALERGDGGCNHITDARSTTSKPERVSWAGSAGVTYQIWVANFGASTDSYSVTAGLTR